MRLSWFLEIPGIFLALPVLWVASCATLARVSGWARLARRFGVSELPGGYQFKMVSGGVGHNRFPVRYRGVISMLLNDEGVGFSLARPFRFGAGAFFIPWEQIEMVEPGRALLTRGTRLHVRELWPVITVLGDPGHVINDWVQEHPDRVTAKLPASE